QKVGGGLGPLGELLAAGQVLEKLVEDGGVAGGGVPPFLEPVLEVGQFLLDDAAGGVHGDAGPGVGGFIVGDPLRGDGAGADDVVDAALEDLELVADGDGEIGHAAGGVGGKVAGGRA